MSRVATARVEQLQCSCCRVSRILKSRLPRSIALFVQSGEFLLRHENFSPHLENLQEHSLPTAAEHSQLCARSPSPHRRPFRPPVSPHSQSSPSINEGRQPRRRSSALSLPECDLRRDSSEAERKSWPFPPPKTHHRCLTSARRAPAARNRLSVRHRPVSSENSAKPNLGTLPLAPPVAGTARRIQRQIPPARHRHSSARLCRSRSTERRSISSALSHFHRRR